MRLLCKFRSVNLSLVCYVRRVISGVMCTCVGTLCELVPGQLVYKNCQHSASFEQSSSEWNAYGVRLLIRIENKKNKNERRSRQTAFFETELDKKVM